MEDKNKDKIIIGLLIALVIVFANNFTNNNKPVFDNKVSLMDTAESKDESDEENISDDNSEIKVHISGEILNEGVYDVNPGDRLDDLVKRAGGFTELANTREINLAMKLEDQMKIYIPNINEVSNNETNITNLTSLPSNIVDTDKININLASKEELMTLPNIGEKRADAIIEYREANKFEKIEDIKNVTGIGDKFFEAMKELITV